MAPMKHLLAGRGNRTTKRLSQCPPQPWNALMPVTTELIIGESKELIRKFYFIFSVFWDVLCVGHRRPSWAHFTPFLPLSDWYAHNHKGFASVRAIINLCFLKNDKYIISTHMCTHSICLMCDPCLSAERMGASSVNEKDCFASSLRL